jgi:hypothetical protein
MKRDKSSVILGSVLDDVCNHHSVWVMLEYNNKKEKQYETQYQCRKIVRGDKKSH